MCTEARLLGYSNQSDIATDQVFCVLDPQLRHQAVLQQGTFKQTLYPGGVTLRQLILQVFLVLFQPGSLCCQLHTDSTHTMEHPHHTQRKYGNRCGEKGQVGVRGGRQGLKRLWLPEERQCQPFPDRQMMTPSIHTHTNITHTHTKPPYTHKNMKGVPFFCRQVSQTGPLQATQCLHAAACL